jgi:putative NADPH-quinone reductase
MRILVIDGHPDADKARCVHAVADAYLAAAHAGHEVRLLRLAELKFPLLRSNDDFLKGTPEGAILAAQADLTWCNHVAVFYPLWLGSMPALLKGLLEQVLRPGFAFGPKSRGMPKKLLKGRSVRIVVTMGMPALFYRWYYRAHSLKSFERNILAFAGFGPIRSGILGSVESAAGRARWLERIRRWGAAGK